MATKSTSTGEKRMTIAEERRQFQEVLAAINDDRDRVEEALSNAVAMLRQEDIGWAQPGDGNTYKGLTLAEVHGWSEQIRASLTGTAKNAPNPHMRNGLMLRHSFVWAGGIHYSDIPGSDDGKGKASARRGKVNVDSIINSAQAKRSVFGSTARKNREHALYADGFYMVVGEDNNKRNLRTVPLSEITATQADDLYEDEIIAYRWTRQEVVRDKEGRPHDSRQPRSVWVYVDWYEGPRYDSFWYAGKKEEVLTGFTAFDLHANRPDGQRFGSPDAISALVWARIIRDLIMNGVKMQDALAMFAFKAGNPSKKGQEQTALEIGKNKESGATAVGGPESDLTPLNTAGKGYDFGSIGFVVSTMAASLHISGIALSANTALAGSSYGAAKTLDLPGRMAMETRRAEHIEFDERILNWLGAKDATAYFDNYDDATDEYRAVQAAMLAWSTGTLTPEGFREELEIVYGRKLAGGIPKGVIVPNNKAQEEKPEKTPTVAAAPDQGQSNGAGNADHASDMPT